jgi:Fe-S cluster biogenesis protein NfuA
MRQKMYIQTESTPNPNTMKFIPGEVVLASGSASFKSQDEARGTSPLATVLFEIPDIEQVFFGLDFITITKKESAEWAMLKASVLTTIMEHYISNRPVMAADNKKEFNRADTAKAEDSELVKQIKELIDTRVRPAVAEDGGDIIFQGFDEGDGVVYLELHGSCSGCPSSTITLKNGIENMLKHYIPEVTSVEAVNGGEEAFDL